MDLIGPLPTTPRGSKYTMTVSCSFSVLPEAAALPDRSAVGVAEFLFKCFTRLGYCKVKISGRDFVNKVYLLASERSERDTIRGVQSTVGTDYRP